MRVNAAKGEKVAGKAVFEVGFMLPWAMIAWRNPDGS